MTGREPIKKVIIHSDGAARGNPGPAAIGGILTDDKGNVLKTISQSIGRATNNQAEYRALITALEGAAKLGTEAVEVNMDSELLVRQLNGQYKVRNAALIDLYRQTVRLLQGFKSFSIRHVPRSQNFQADRLANEAFKGDWQL